jgi:amidase
VIDSTTPPPGSASATARQIAAAVRTGTQPPRAAVTAALARIAERDPMLGAFQLVRGAAALTEADALDARIERADRADLPLAGVPIAVKDVVDVAGEPTRHGSAATSEAPAVDDHELVRRLRAAGAVIVGKTRLPELSLYGVTDSTFGVTRNPWDPARTAGGSSGGSAAAVAAGMVPLAHGTDGLGSIRIPAACCGLFGIKPGTGVVPGGISGNDWFGMSESGALATTVGDAALLLSVLADRRELAEVHEPDRPLRVAVSLKPPLAGVRLDPEHGRAVVRAARLLEAAGHHVVRRSMVVPTTLAAAVFGRWYAGASIDADALDRSRLDRAARGHVRVGDVVRRFGLVKESQRAAVRQLAAEFFADADVYLTPVLAAPPIRAVRWGRKAMPVVVAANVRYAPYAAPWNFTGYPAASVPAGVHPVTGTPLAVQIAAPLQGERLLLSVAAQLERLAPWPRTAPGC